MKNSLFLPTAWLAFIIGLIWLVGGVVDYLTHYSFQDLVFFTFMGLGCFGIAASFRHSHEEWKRYLRSDQ